MLFIYMFVFCDGYWGLIIDYMILYDNVNNYNLLINYIVYRK